MEPPLLQKYIQSIEDFVFIEEKIVTYLWLCQILKIHVNTAKQLLYAFSTKEDFKNKLLVTYVVGGEQKNGKGKLLKLVIADSREAVKQLFSKITTDHIFSIQQSGGSYSSADLYNSYPHFSIASDNRKFCPIKPSQKIDKREVKHVAEVKNYLNSKSVVKPNPPKVSEEPKKEVKETDSRTVVQPENTTSDGEPPQKQKKLSGNEKDVKNNKAGSIGSFFNRQAEKKSSGSPTEKKQTVDKKDEKAKSGIGAFFKPGNKNEIEKNKSVIKEKEKERIVETKEVEKEAEVKEQKNDVKQTNGDSTKGKKAKGKASKRKRKKKDQEDGSQKKRRKRIMSVLSSDSGSDSDGSNESEMEVEPEEPPPPPPPIDDEEDIIPPTPGRKRIRKEIDMTFTDEEGFIITKKEFVYESCSDNETEEKNVENKENNTAKKESTPQKTPERKEKEISSNPPKKKKSSVDDKSNKQSSIKNFFTRKATS